MRKLAVLFGIGVLLLLGGSAMAQEYHLQLSLFSVAQTTVNPGGYATLAVIIWNPAPYGSGIYLSAVGYLTVQTPWGGTLTWPPVIINNVTPATTRSQNWRMPVSLYAPPGTYLFHGWLEEAGVMIDEEFDSLEVVP